jgi:hypothetical protein
VAARERNDAKAQELTFGWINCCQEETLNLSTGTTEFSLRDRNGYYVTISALDPI